MSVGFSLRRQCRRYPLFANFFGRTKATSTPSLSYRTPIYQWLEDVENLEAYCSGGYHPIQLGDEFSQGRYRVVHKLGYGSFSTVWLARDSATKRYVSLKVIAARFSERSMEAKVLNHIYRDTSHHPGRTFVSSLLDEFSVTGPNGTHRCLVGEVLGPSVQDVKECHECELLPLSIAQRVTVQLAMGLAAIHSCGIIHGDIHMKNIAFKLPNIDSWPVDKVYEHCGVPETQEIIRYDGKPLGSEVPPYAVIPTMFHESGNLPLGEISILDFGEASFATETRTQWHTPILLQAPEALLGEPVGQSADIWAFACTVFALFNNASLFRGYMPNSDEVLSEIIDALGSPPKRWWEKWEQRVHYYEDDGTKKTENLIESYREVKPLVARISSMRFRPPAAREAEQVDGDEMAGLQTLLERCLRYEPEERATAEEILRMDWMKRIRASL